MTTTELINKKNQIVFNVTGKMLVPVDQIVEVKVVRLEPHFNIRSDNCTYCELFLDNGCKDCPMALAENECVKDVNNTYDICNRLWNQKVTQEDEQKLYDLIVEYNESNGF